jgi:hypothetical protein
VSVKVQYTIPGWEPAASPAQRLETAPAVFEERLREAGRPLGQTWRRVLRADLPQPGELALAPPERPLSHVYSDAAEDRRRWQGLLRRHVVAMEAGRPEVARMLAALARMEEGEVEIQTRMTREGQR